MKTIEGDLIGSRPRTKGVGLTIGNFDGVHRGHQRLINQLVSQCEDREIPSAILTFHPHPSQVLDDSSYTPLLTKKEKINRLERLDPSWLFIQKFNLSFSEIEARSFLLDFVLPYFQPKLILFGYDFRFGSHGKGDFKMAQKLLSDQSIELVQASALALEGQTVSSSLIRKKLLSGKVAEANQLLGYQFFIEGQVVKGDAIGRTLGFPTANLDGIHSLLPGHGVYQVDVLIKGGEYHGIVNIGLRPTLEGGEQLKVECHVFDFSQDIYDEKIKVFFVEKVRDEKKFSGLEELKKQIEKDVKYLKMKLGRS